MVGIFWAIIGSGLNLSLESVYKCFCVVMPYLIQHPESIAKILQKLDSGLSKDCRNDLFRGSRRDTDDLIFSQLALESSAKFIVSGDSHLLDLKKVDNIQILDVNEFLRICD